MICLQKSFFLFMALFVIYFLIPPPVSGWHISAAQVNDFSNNIVHSSKNNFGDVNDDGNIGVKDAILILRHIVGLEVLEDNDALQRADVNLDGKVNVTDAINVLRLTVGLIDKFTPVDPAVISTEHALRYVMEETDVSEVLISDDKELVLTEDLPIKRDISLINLHIISPPADEGTVVLREKLGKNTLVNLYAIPSSEYYHDSWIIDGKKKSTDQEFEFLMPDQYTKIRANFEPVVIPVATAEDLNNIRNPELNIFGEGTEREGEYTGGPDKNYELLADIDLDSANFNDGKGWYPIGSYDENNPDESLPFTGVLDGNGHKISNLAAFRSETEEPVGLFAYLGKKASVKDINLENINVKGNNLAGGLAGINEGTIVNISVTGTVTGKSAAGALAGRNSGSITDCSAVANVTGDDILGGLVGHNDGTITDSHAEGVVTGDLLEDISLNISGVGGLAGFNWGEIKNSYAKSDVTGSFFVGGLIGLNHNGSKVSKSHASGNVIALKTEPDNNENDDFKLFGAGGLAGANKGEITESYAEIESVAGDQIAGGLAGINTGSISDSYANYDGDNRDAPVTGAFNTGGLVGLNLGGTIKESYAGVNVTGTTESIDFLYSLEDFYTKNFTDGSRYLIADIIKPPDLYNDTFFAVPGTGGLVGATFKGEITNSSASGDADAFTIAGGFIGININGIISNCYAEGDVTSRYYAGGFAGIHRYNVISDSHASGNASVFEPEGGIMDDAGFDEEIAKRGLYGGRAGGFAGGNFAQIINCYAEGHVTGFENTGGLAGINGDIIKGSYATGDVTRTERTTKNERFPVGVGGLAGVNYFEGSIAHSYASGNVVDLSGSEETGDDFQEGAGGLVGVSTGCDDTGYGEIIESHSSGNVTGDKNVGGLVGYARFSGIMRTYALGNATGDTLVGGLIGFGEFFRVYDSYARGETEGIDYVGGLVGLIGDMVTEDAAGYIINCYATGEVYGEKFTGGIAAGGNTSDVINTYYDMETTGQEHSPGGGNGRTTEEMTYPRDLNTYEEWDFENTWDENADFNDGYPYLRWQLSN